MTALKHFALPTSLVAPIRSPEELNKEPKKAGGKRIWQPGNTSSVFCDRRSW